MKFFNVPADFKKETIDEYVRLNRKYKDSKVIEVYGNVTLGTNFGSGRVLSQLPRVDLLDLREYIQYAREHDIEFSYTLNAPYLQNREFTAEGVLSIKALLKDLVEIGVDSLTVAMPSLIELVKISGYDFKIKASTICHITNAHKARAYKRMGVEKIVVDESIHRDFDALKRILKAFGPKVELIANTMCHRNCAYRQFHYNETGGDSTGACNEVGVNFFEHKCMLQRYENSSELLKLGWIRPEDLKYYTSIGIGYFKLQGRQHVHQGDPIRALEHYFKEDYQGNLMDLLDMFNSRYSFKVHLDNKKLEGFIKPFFENKHICQYDCSHCGYCQSYARKAIDANQAETVMNSAKQFYREYNQYEKLIRSTEPNTMEVEESVQEDMETEFNIE